MTELRTERRGRKRQFTVEEHKARGTYREDRHGHLAPKSALGVPPKPPGKITATKRSQQRWVRNASDELAIAEGCRFNQRLADHVVNFFSKFLKHSAGQWAGQPFDLEDWQIEKIIYPIFGWVRKDGMRRIRRTYIELPKKNGKSAVASGIGLYMLVGDEEPGAEVYSFAGDKDQARIVHGEAINMIEASPALDANLNINRTTGVITYQATKSFYRVRSGSPKNIHGIKPHCGICDELHEWHGRELWDGIRYGYKMRRQPIEFVITNAGNSMECVCREQRDKAQAIIDGTLQDLAFYPLIFSAEREEAEAEVKAVAEGSTDMPVARRCNPGLGTIIRDDSMIEDIKDAAKHRRMLPNLLRLTYGIWATGDSPWIDAAVWSQCGEEYGIDDIADKAQCWGALDLSRTRDLTAFALVFPNGGADDVDTWVKFWIPEERVRELDHLVGFRQWADEGHIEIVPGAAIEAAPIVAAVAEAAERFDLQTVAYDPHNASLIQQELQDQHGIDCEPFKQQLTTYAAPTKHFEALLLHGGLRHPNNPVLNWQAGHVVVKPDVNNNIRPLKPEKGDYRTVDGIQALVMALGQMMGESQFIGSEDVGVDVW